MTTQDDLLERIRENLAHVQGRIDAAAGSCRRDPAGIRLLAVSKTHPVEAVLAGLAAGHRLFGESYAQELVTKHDHFPPGEGPPFHFIGGLQRNKVKMVVGRASLIHSVDRRSLLQEIDRQAGLRGLVQPILLEVNVGGEASKSGCTPVDLPELLRAARAMEHVAIHGLMTLPPFDLDADEVRPHFVALRRLRDEVAERLPATDAVAFCELSMGMSHDLEVAVEEGATLVRVGTAIFGQRRTRA
ncbi:MAG: YggS family pyridoxal phosphate-dependent enzyme [Pseudomonadota bacterium]